MSLSVSRIDSIALYVSNMDLAGSFLIECLGHREIERSSNSFGETRVYDIGNRSLDLIQLWDPIEDQPLAQYPVILKFSAPDPEALLRNIELWTNKNKIEAYFDTTHDRHSVTMLKLLAVTFNFVKEK